MSKRSRLTRGAGRGDSLLHASTQEVHFAGVLALPHPDMVERSAVDDDREILDNLGSRRGPTVAPGKRMREMLYGIRREQQLIEQILYCLLM